MPDATPGADGSDDPVLGEIEATYGRTLFEWDSVVRQWPGFGTDGADAEITKMLETDYGMTPQHAEALTAHTLGRAG